MYNRPFNFGKSYKFLMIEKNKFFASHHKEMTLINSIKLYNCKLDIRGFASNGAMCVTASTVLKKTLWIHRFLQVYRRRIWTILIVRLAPTFLNSNKDPLYKDVLYLRARLFLIIHAKQIWKKWPKGGIFFIDGHDCQLYYWDTFA